MFYFNINPVFANLGPFQIRYYGIIYAFGFLLTYFILLHFSKKKKLQLKVEDLDTLLLYLVLGVVLGARIIYIIFYNLSFYLAHPLDILAIWHGGLSFHGGLLGAFLALLLFCKKKNYNFFHLADYIVIPASLALMLGRIGNFLNGELYGRITSLPWGVKFPNVEGFRHPSQIYEAAKNLLIFSILWFQEKKKNQEGYLFGLFLLLYGLLRFLVEFVREPEIYIGPLTMGQVLSIPVAIIGLMVVVKKRKS